MNTCKIFLFKISDHIYCKLYTKRPTYIIMTLIISSDYYKEQLTHNTLSNTNHYCLKVFLCNICVYDKTVKKGKNL